MTLNLLFTASCWKLSIKEHREKQVDKLLRVPLGKTLSKVPHLKMTGRINKQLSSLISAFHKFLSPQTSLAESGGGGGCDENFLSSEGGRGAEALGGGGSLGAGGGG